MLPQTDWDVGVSAVNDANGMTYSSVGEQPIVSTEIPDTDWTELPVDSHGTAILGIDRDGLLDIYIATGGGMGLESGPAMNAAVLWGEPSAASVNVWSWVVVPTRAVGQISFREFPVMVQGTLGGLRTLRCHSYSSASSCTLRR